MNDFEQELKEILVSETSFAKAMEPMRNHTTFRVGGPAGWYVAPGNEKELAEVIRLCRREDVPVRILGNGSNLLVSDLGIEGVVIAMEENWNYAEMTEPGVMTVGSGMLLSKAASLALKENLTGLEAASGIPGTMGGAVVMNAGAYGFEMKDVLSSVRVMAPEGNVITLDAGDMELGYRTSCVEKNGYVVLEAQLSLKAGDGDQIRGRMDELAAKRREKQPLEYPSAGSTFKRPSGHFAGQLIEQAGMRGFRLGGAQVSEKHCGFVINRGEATAEDVISLCRHVQKAVKETSGVDLEMEVRRWGEFS